VALPELLVTVFSDYICPFCYIGDARLNQLRDSYDLKVNWCLLEIHPDTPVQGMPVTDLGYPPAQWQRMMDILRDMAAQDGLPLRDHLFTTNSRKALLLAEAAKEARADIFYALHQALFDAYFVAGENIGDEVVLRHLADQAGMDMAQVEQAWGDPAYEQRLRQYLMAAQELNVAATPTFFIGRQRLDGAVPVEQLSAAAARAHAG